jgi:hypothetical protein
MGLTLCYRLTLPGKTDLDVVRQKLTALKDFAATLDFDDVLGPSEYTADELIEEAGSREIVPILVSVMCGDTPDFYGRQSSECCALAFVVVPGEECEPAVFGFVAPGSRRSSRDDDLCPGDWFWSGFCKTQYASIISDEHLVKCHLGLVRVLEHAATLGITVEVHDETGYWERRSTTELIKVTRDMNRLIARIAGELANKHRVDAPIFAHPDFEHLEMEDLELYGQADGSDPCKESP